MTESKTHQNGKPKKTRKKAAKTEGKGKKLSALDAAAKVLAETGQPMSCKEMIEKMAQKRYSAGRPRPRLFTPGFSRRSPPRERNPDLGKPIAAASPEPNRRS
ncbi:MAG TPA: hypothetical protein VGX70_08570 [Gemmataceae bacterium]|jgi:hypothetical protein|nr:hypothetical protein [Gemmataceae bacterium]